MITTTTLTALVIFSLLTNVYLYYRMEKIKKEILDEIKGDAVDKIVDEIIKETTEEIEEKRREMDEENI